MKQCGSRNYFFPQIFSSLDTRLCNSPLIQISLTPLKICIGIVFDLMSQEKLKTIIMQNFGGLKRCIMGYEKVEKYLTIRPVAGQ